MSACLFVTSNWTDMVSLYREAFHTSWEGLKLFRGRLQPPPKYFEFSLPVLQCTVCTILGQNPIPPYLRQPFLILYLYYSVEFVPFWIIIFSCHICGSHFEFFTCVAVYSLYHSGSESSPAIFAAAMWNTYVSLSNTLNVHYVKYTYIICV